MSVVYALEGVHYAYRDQPALAGIDLTIRAGERVALLGPNGSGKSTLLRLLDGLAFARQGRVQAFGTDLTEAALADAQANYAFRRRVGLVFQSPDVQLFNPTVQDEIAFGPLQLGWEVARVRRAIAETMARHGLSGLKDRAPHRLSGGEKKRVALASVLVTEPEVLLMDEPTAALDPASRDGLVHFLAGGALEGRTAVVATHELDIVAAIADRAVVMVEGRIIADGPPAAILADHALLHRARLTHSHRQDGEEVHHVHALDPGGHPAT